MIIFIDESGTHKNLGYSTVAIVYIKASDLNKIGQQVLDIERGLSLKSFHWGETNWQVKNKFLSGLLKIDFTAKIAIFRNMLAPEKIFESAIINLITEDIKIMIVDGKKSKRYEKKLKKFLRGRGLHIKKLRTAKGISHPGLHIADALAGLTRRYYDNSQGDGPGDWMKKFKEKNKLVIYKNLTLSGEVS